MAFGVGKKNRSGALRTLGCKGHREPADKRCDERGHGKPARGSAQQKRAARPSRDGGSYELSQDVALLSLSTPDRPVCQDQYVPRCGDLLCRHVRKQYTRLAVENQHARCKLVERFQRKLFLFVVPLEEKPQ